jgi:ubiquinone/menaquinone biosynthesis C-methylase UbiE
MITQQHEDYDRYKDVQVSRSKKKWNSNTFKENIGIFNSLMSKSVPLIGNRFSVCCMGIRGGNEYIEFKERFEHATVYGVDICDDVIKVGDNCFSYDFSNLPKEWDNKFDVVYSNSIDHSFNAFKTVEEWYRVCKGYIILTMSSFGYTSESDCVDFNQGDLDILFPEDKFEIIDITTFDNHPVFNVVIRVKK